MHVSFRFSLLFSSVAPAGHQTLRYIRRQIHRSTLNFNSCWKHSDPHTQNNVTAVSMRLFIALALVLCVAAITALEINNCLTVQDKYLVAEVADDQLSASSNWCTDHKDTCYTDNAEAQFPKYARLDSKGAYTGGWSASTLDENQYIQVDFGIQKVITGAVLQARDYVYSAHWVEKYKVMTSDDCETFNTIKDENGEDEIFNGNTGLDEDYITFFSCPVQARCVRINPTAWHGFISLRFDILGI